MVGGPMKLNEAVWVMFERTFLELETLCFRDAEGLRRYKPEFRRHIRNLHNVTHMELDDCVQIIMEIAFKGCYNFYRTQYEELRKYTDVMNVKPKRKSRALFTTFMKTHMENKYNSYMTGFFAQIRSFEAGRVGVEIEEIVDHKNGHDVKKKVIGTLPLVRYAVDDSESPVSILADISMRGKSSCRAQFNEFVDQHEGVIDTIIHLTDEDLDGDEDLKRGLMDLVTPIAIEFGFKAHDFVHAVRGIFGGCGAQSA